MNNMNGQGPFNGMLPPLQTTRVQAPYAPPVPPPERIERPLVMQAPAPTVANVARTRAKHEEEEPVIVDDQFTYDGFQVVRGEYFSHMNEPSITFSDNTFCVNMACLRKAPGTEFVQVLVNQVDQKLVIRPCTEDVKDSFAWHTLRRKPKKVICPLFFGKIMSLMNWNPEHRYKIIGKLIMSQGQYLFVFDLKCPEIYQRSMQIDENGNEKRKSARKPVYLDSWKDQFGMPVAEHQQSLQINIFDEFFIVGVKEPKRATASESTKEGEHDQPEPGTEHPTGLPTHTDPY